MNTDRDRRAPGEPLVGAEFWERPQVRYALGERDISTVYRALTATGVSQRQIALVTGQSQSEVSEIRGGRRVIAYDVLARIADSFGIPRELMGLGVVTVPAQSYPGGCAGGGARSSEDIDAMLRRDLIAQGALVVFGAPILGELCTASGPRELGLPARLAASDIGEITATTERLRAAARTYGGQARAAAAAAVQYERLLTVPAPAAVTTRLHAALAELFEFAGWACFDTGHDQNARWLLRSACEHATAAGDNARVASVMSYGSIIDNAAGHPNDALKTLQVASQLTTGPSGDPTERTWIQAHTAYSLMLLGRSDPARETLGRALEEWVPPNPLERADMDYQSGLLHAGLGELDTAADYASRVSGAGLHRPVGVYAGVLSATVTVRAGDSRGPVAARSAIEAVAPLHSRRARDKLVPLAEALEARGPGYRDIAVAARRVIAA